ncbi:hypothetical protein ACH5RR_031795 [Cinchona calisaya]|uniref:Ubiquitin-like domain-containing protein n=1 Tax=Cinchona calisaya TaxID=153742 RepID=A0ABD2YG91_9GENT
MAAAAEVGEAREMEKSKPTDHVHVSLSVKSQDGRETYFKIKRDTKLKKLLLIYCQKYFLDYDTLHFYLEGEHFNHNKTPNELGLEDDAEIECMADQLGAGDMSSSWSIVD